MQEIIKLNPELKSKLKLFLSINDRMEDSYEKYYKNEDKLHERLMTVYKKRITNLDKLIPKNLGNIIEINNVVETCETFIERDKNLYRENPIQENLEMLNISIEMYNDNMNNLINELNIAIKELNL